MSNGRPKKDRARSARSRASYDSQPETVGRTDRKGRESVTRRIGLLALLALAGSLRAYRVMTDYPIVSDESIYLRWAEIIDHQGQWFISLLDGKQPLNFWIYALERMLLPDLDPLFLARITSVVAGVGSTWLLFWIGKRLDGDRAGFLAAGFYAVFPWAMMYDRLAYTEGLLNFFGILSMWTCLWAFETSDPCCRRMVLAGVALGAAYFVKTPAVLFLIIPLLIGLWRGSSNLLGLALRWGVIIGIAAIFPAISAVMKPDAPMFGTHDLLLHQTTFFADPGRLLQDPFYLFVKNAPRFGEYLPYLVGWPAATLAFLSAGYLIVRRSTSGIVVTFIAVIPLCVQLFVVTFFPTRYPYAFLWPWLVLTALAVTQLERDLAPRLTVARARSIGLAVALCLIAGPMGWRTWKILHNPQDEISPHDSGYYFGDYAHSGFGVRPAIDFLSTLSEKTGPFVLLVDPIWNLPADGVFPYLNNKHGIRVYEAWWTQLSPDHAIMPNATVEVMRSHYERVPMGKVDFTRERRVFYLTDTNYYPPEAVAIRQPSARPIARFDKPNQEHAIDIYQLK